MQELYKVVKNGGKLSKKTEGYRFGGCISELIILEDSVLVRGKRFIIPNKLRKNVLQAAHQGHPGKDLMLRELRMSV